MIVFCKEKNSSIKHLITTFFFLFVATIMCAQRYLGEAKVECPNSVRIGEQFSYKITLPVDTSFHETVLPPFTDADLKIITGPSLSTSTTYSLINGKSNTTCSRTYTYILKGLSDDMICIPSYTIGNHLTGDYYTVPEKIILCKNISEKSLKKDVKKDTLLCLTSVDKTYISIDDSVLVTTRLYASSKYTPLNLQVSHRLLPDFCFCQSVKLDSLTMELDSINGITCRSCIIDSYWLHPCKTGIVEIPSNSYSVQVMEQDESVDTFEAFFNSELRKEITALCKTPPVTVNVKALPLLKVNYSADLNERRNGTVFALDISGSMGYTFDFSSSRLEMAKNIIRKSCGEATTIIPFASNREPSITYPLMSNVLDTITKPKNDGTALYDLCMSVAMDTINNYRDIIVLTDGNDNCSHISLKTLTHVMKKCGIRVNIVSINSERDSIQYKSLEPDTILTIKNEIPLESDFIYLTKETEGIWVRCTNEKEMARAIKQITTFLQRPYKRTDLRQTNEDFYYRLKRNYLKTQNL